MKTDRKESTNTIPVERITQSIVLLRGHKIILDVVLADLYEVETRVLIQAVKRNLTRFPEDFMFQLTAVEAALLRSQSLTLKTGRGQHRKYLPYAFTVQKKEYSNLRSQSVTSSQWGGRRTLPYAFTEQGVAMLSSVLRSDRAVQVNIEIMRAFVKLRQMMGSHKELSRKLENLEKKYDSQFKVVFDAIRQLMKPPHVKNKRPIGFAPWKDK